MKFAFFFVCLCGFAPSLVGQSPHFREYSLLKKDDPIQIKALFQDASGYIWIGSNKGLFRFDGINKVRFTQANGLPDETVTSLAQDSSGRIWTGHKNGHLSFQDGSSFKEFKPQEGSATAEISKIYFDAKGTMWFTTLNDGLYYYKKDRLFRLDESDGMPDLYIYDLAEDAQGNIWTGTDRGIAIINPKENKVRIQTLNTSSGLPDNIIRKIVIQHDTAWIGTEDKGIFPFSTSTFKSLADQYTWHLGSLNDFLITHGQIWSTTSSGLNVTNIKSKKTHPVTDDKIHETSLNKILSDQEGNIWISHPQGLLRCFGEFIQIIDTEKEFNIKNIVALAIDHAGDLWLSSDEGIYKRSVNASGKVIIQKQLVNTPYEKFPFISLYADDAGNIWAGTYGQGVIRLDTRSGSITHINKELRNGNVLSINGKKNEIWLATLGGGTQIKLKENDLEIKNFGSEEGLKSDYNYQIFIDSRDRKWFATDGKGAFVLEGTEFHHLNDSSKSRVLYGFAEDRDGVIWTNTQTEGIYKSVHGKFEKFSQRVLGENNYSIFTTDVFGNLVAANDAGIDVLDFKTKEVHHFGEEYGIGGMKPNLNALAKDQAGILYFGTNNGIIQYSSAFYDLPHAPRSSIESLKNSNHLFPTTGNLEFPYNQNHIVFGYTAFWFQNPEEIIFSYQLENYDEDWIQSKDRSATYYSLPPGTYTFKLKASSSADFSNAKEVTLTFSINPPFWKRVWFYILIGLTLLYLTYSIFRYSERKLLRDNHNLELKVKERYAQILKKNEEINMQAEEIRTINENLEKLVQQRTELLERKNKALEEAAFINAHELRAPVASILGLIHLMDLLNLSENDHEYLSHLESSVKKLDVVIKRISTAIDSGDSPIQTFNDTATGE
jgi:ligand-binding sensor domain-containing protein